MSAFAAAAYRFWAMVVFVAVLVQIGAAGYGAFYAGKHADALSGKKFDHGFGLHIALGYLLFLATLLLLVFALAAASAASGCFARSSCSGWCCWQSCSLSPATASPRSVRSTPSTHWPSSRSAATSHTTPDGPESQRHPTSATGHGPSRERPLGTSAAN